MVPVDTATFYVTLDGGIECEETSEWGDVLREEGLATEERPAGLILQNFNLRRGSRKRGAPQPYERATWCVRTRICACN